MSFPRVRITGGPNPRDVKVVDADTGVEIPEILSATIDVRPDRLVSVKLEVLAELDVEAERPSADDLAELRRRCNSFAGGIRSFLSSLPFAAPEAIDAQTSKLRGPLAEWERLEAERSGTATSGGAGA